ncbi:hypothetical protein G3I34_19185 [Streptomyces sp. SID8014]|uniref:hypothetical protein n=1 Tax=Streptomyces sp. SID8014 TaxID=2706097 RepID=UPI0013B9D69F|nr:hypothetical protein [Streptomyces sp. SID8014]NEC14350.1 hypothetical protein [Streptomyces sp. SID8014]
MTQAGATRTDVGAASFVHTGTGNNNIFVEFAPPPRKPPRRLAREELYFHMRRFVRPAAANAAYDTLARDRLVVLTGPDGSGRQTAGRVLLGELPGREVPFELVPDVAEDGHHDLDPELVQPGNRLLLDLTATEEPARREMAEQLPNLWEQVREQAAHLVVLHPDADRELPYYVASQVHHLAPPDRTALLRRRLRCEGMDTRACAPVPETLGTYLTTRPPVRDVARLAHAVIRLRRRHRHDIHGFTDTPELFAEWCEKALSTLTDPQAAVDAIVDKATKAHERAFCYATALLEGARTDTVYAAARILMTATATPADPQPLLEQNGTHHLLRTIEADRVDDRHTFAQQEVAEALCRHLWSDRPDLRGVLLDCTPELLALPSLDERERKSTAGRVAGLMTGTEPDGVLRQRVEGWAEQGTTGSLTAATALLDRLVQHPLLGAAWRRWVYDRAGVQALSPGLRRVLIGVCATTMATRYPRSALIRLHRLAASEPEGQEATRALLDHVRDDAQALHHLLHRLSRRLEPHNRYPRDLDLFLAVAADRSLLAQTVTAFGLSCWRSVFRAAEPERWRPAAAPLLEPEAAADTLRSLIEAAGRDHPTLNALYLTAVEAGPPAHADRVLRLICDARSPRPPRPMEETAP